MYIRSHNFARSAQFGTVLVVHYGIASPMACLLLESQASCALHDVLLVMHEAFVFWRASIRDGK